LVLSLLFSLLKLPLVNSLNFTYLIDLSSRSDLNENYLGSYFFYWTNFWYLPVFYFLLLIVLIRVSVYLRILIFVLLILYVSELLDFILLNAVITDNFPSNYNKLLANPLNKYHPLIFFISTVIFFSSFIFSKYSISNSFSKTLFFNNLKKVNSSAFFLNTTSILLGSWWALQETTWGGWWNWDPSEVFGLLFTITSLYFLHSPLKLFYNYRIIVLVLTLTLFLIYTYFLIQLNFEIVSHNFGFKSFFFFNNNLFLNELIILNLSVMVVLLHSITKNLFSTKKLFQNSLNSLNIGELRTTTVLYLFTLTSVLLFFYTFRDSSIIILLNLTQPNFWTFSLINNEVFLVLVTILLLFKYSKLKNTYAINLLPTIWFMVTPSLFLILTTQYFNRVVVWVHLTLLILFFKNLLFFNTDFIHWLLLPKLNEQILEKSILYFNSSLRIIDNFSIASGFLFFTKKCILTSWSFSLYLNIFEINLFILFFSSVNVSNFYILGQDKLVISILIENLNNSSMVFFTFLIMVVTFKSLVIPKLLNYF